MSDARHYTAMEFVRQAIVALCDAGSLPGISSANVKAMLLPLVDRAVKQRSLSLPAIIVSPSVSETINANAFGMTGDNVADYYGYPVTVAVVDSSDATSLFSDLKLYLKWREVLIKKFHRQTVTGDDAIAGTLVEPMDVVSLNAWVGSGLFASGFIVRTISREVVR